MTTSWTFSTWAVGSAYGPIRSGFAAALAGDVPLGAGLSSSASLQAAFALFLAGAGLAEVAGADPDDAAGRLALAQALRRSENEYVGYPPTSAMICRRNNAPDPASMAQFRVSRSAF